LARDYQAGILIEPFRYAPPRIPPGFPKDIGASIRAWNRSFEVDFYSCRQALKAIAERYAAQVRCAVRRDLDNLGRLKDEMAGRNFLLFFHDDDDIFHPELLDLVSKIHLEDQDIAVFPLVRFEEHTATFVRRNAAARTIVGSRRDFTSRFQTNNYALSSHSLSPENVSGLADHLLGSEYADAHELKDRYFDVLLSATIKSPCSASYMPNLITQGAEEHRLLIHRFIDRLEALVLPPEMSWAGDAITATCSLFLSVVSKPVRKAPTVPRLLEENASLQQDLDVLRAERDLLKKRYEAIVGSTVWRASTPLRLMIANLPPGWRKLVRRLFGSLLRKG
jgi:hypothetical protein